MADQLTTMKVSEIVVEENHNPRENFAKQPLEQLAASIKINGLVQPLLVTPLEKGKAKLIDGERRLRAAKMAKVTAVPVYVRDDVNGNATALAMVANLLREELDPIEQAKGFKRLQEENGWNQKRVATEVSVSQSFVSQRLALLKLPEIVQGYVARGQIKMEVTKPIAIMAEGSEQFATAMADTLIDAEPYDVESFETDTGEWVAETIGHSDADVPNPVELCGQVDAVPGPRWNDSDVDAAKQYGCLIQIVDPPIRKGLEPRTLNYTFDGTWLDERMALKQQAWEKKRAKEATERAESGSTEPTSSGATLTPEEAEAQKAEREEQREAENALRRAALAFNEEVGSKLARAYFAPEITTERAKLIAKILLNVQQFKNLGSASLAFLDPKLIEVNDRGTVKVMDRADSEKELMRRIEEADTPERVFGWLLYGFVGQALADYTCVAQSAKPYLAITEDYTEKPISKAILIEALNVLEPGNLRDDVQGRLNRLLGDDDE